ncbi:MAG: glycosyltransferase family 4 protein [Pirellulaceae bacterium]
MERADAQLGGAERSILELSRELRRQSVEATILAASGDTSHPEVRILGTGEQRQRVSLAAFARRAGEYLDARPVDIVHSTLPLALADIYQPRGGSYREAMVRNAASYGRADQRFFKKTFHFLNFRRTEKLWAEQRLLARDSKTIVAPLSHYVERHFLRYYAVPKNRVVTVPNGVQLRSTSDSLAGKRFRGELLRSTGHGSTRPAALFLFAAHNFRLKGLEECIRAFAQAATGPGGALVLAVAGKGRRPERYRRLASRLGVGERVVFTGPVADLKPALEACDAAVLPTYYDPSSRFVLEALAMKKPVITTRFNGAAEMMRSGRHGMVVREPSDTAALAEAMRMYANPDRRQQARKAIEKDRLDEQISIARHVRQLISLYAAVG